MKMKQGKKILMELKNELKQKFNQLAKMMIAAHALYLQKGELSSYLFISEEEHILS